MREKEILQSILTGGKARNDFKGTNGEQMCYNQQKCSTCAEHFCATHVDNLYICATFNALEVVIYELLEDKRFCKEIK